MTVRLTGGGRGSGLPAIDRRRFRSRAVRVLRELSHARSELSIALVDDETIRCLNDTWRGRDEATDVLSFSLLDGAAAEHRGRLLGDVVISLETAARQARARRRSLDEEVTRLLTHGVLHLLGHDHEQDDDARRMAAEERRLWRALREDGG